MKLELAILAGPESKAFLQGLTEQIDRLEALTKNTPKVTKAEKKSAAALDEEDEETVEESSDEDDDFSAKPAARKVAASALEDDEEDEVPAKKGKPKKLTSVDVNNACKAKARETSREEVLRILKKKFKVESVTDLEEKQYAAVIEAMEL